MNWTVPPRAAIRIWTLVLAVLSLLGCSPPPLAAPATAPSPTPTQSLAPETLAPPTATLAPPTATLAPPTTAPGYDFDLAKKLDEEVEGLFSESDCPGLAIGVVRDQELVYAKGFGVTNLETGEDVTPRTLFHMASITKPFVATSIMQLLEEGKLALDDPIVQHLPYFELNDERYTELTIRQFLHHSSGMPNVEDYHWDDPEYDEGALERYVRSLGDRELLDDPGRWFAYSNMAFEVLGDLIAKVSGQSFADYLKEQISFLWAWRIAASSSEMSTLLSWPAGMCRETMERFWSANTTLTIAAMAPARHSIRTSSI